MCSADVKALGAGDGPPPESKQRYWPALARQPPNLVPTANFAAYVVAFMAYYVCGYAFQWGAVAINAAPANIGGPPTRNEFLIGAGQWGFLGGKGFFLEGPAYDASANVLMLFQVVFMETAGYIIVGSICERITFGGFLLCQLFMGAILYSASTT